MKETIPDTMENRRNLARFVAQEVVKDGKIPHFYREAVLEIIREARRRSGRKGQLTLMLRDLGGLIRVAGDLAREENAKYVSREHVIKAKQMARTLEQQISDNYVKQKKDYEVVITEGTKVGRVNGLAVIGNSGIVSPIEVEVAPALSSEEGRIVATGKLGKIAREAVQNVSAVFKKYSGETITKYDIHIQFVQTYEGVEGDSASISVAAAVISALEGIPVKQDTALTGSLSVRGNVLPVGGIISKIEAAAEAGIKQVIIPKANQSDVLLEKKYEERIKVIPVNTIGEVLEHALFFEDKQIMEKIEGFSQKTPIKKHSPSSFKPQPSG